MTAFDYRPRTRVVFGPGEFARLGEVAREAGGTKCLLVADPGMVEAGYASEAVRSLRARRMEVFAFHDFAPNPTTSMVEAGAAYATPHDVNLIVALGGGSSMDCAKAINFLASNGGKISAYAGYGKAQKPMIPMIAVPTTAGSGSEARSVAVITDAATRKTMSCGDAKLYFRTVILDPKLTLTQPARLTAESGFDALSHALETLVATRQTAFSECFSREAWKLLHSAFERAISEPEDLETRGELLMGAHFGGLAVESAALGAAHACAHPLTEGLGFSHGAAIALVLPATVEWNSEDAGGAYRAVYSGALPERLRRLAQQAGLPVTLREAGVPEEALPRLAEEAGAQWFGRFNPRPFDAEGALEIYEMAR